MNAFKFFFFLVLPSLVFAEIKTKTVEYKDGDTVLEGYLAYDVKAPAKKPAILVIHDWMGVGPFTKKRVEKLAQMGYVAFAADIYGKNIRPKNAEEAATQAGIYKNNRETMRSRVKAGLEQLKKFPQTNLKSIAAIGYCFGGTTALELARSGADIQGVVSFHGGLNTPKAEDAKNIKAKVLVLHGADDPFVPLAEVTAFEDEMRAANVDWELVKYSKAVHSFTNPDSGNDPSKGMAYNKEAEQRSWKAMKAFFDEVLVR